jgi:dolichol-phosphate mannosyltransferase
MSKTVPYRKALYANCGLKLSTISYKPEGQSRQGRGDKELNRYRRKTAMDTLIIFTDVAYRLSIIMTCIMMFLSLAGGVYTVVIFTMGRPVAGYTTTMLVLTVSFFAVFLILAIIIKYLSVLVNMVFLRQSYMVEGVEKVK